MTTLDEGLTEHYGASIMNLVIEEFLRSLVIQYMLRSFLFFYLTSKLNLLLRDVE